MHPHRWSTAWITPVDPSSHTLIYNPHPPHPPSSPQSEKSPSHPPKINPSTQTHNCTKITPSTLKIAIHTPQYHPQNPQIHSPSPLTPTVTPPHPLSTITTPYTPPTIPSPPLNPIRQNGWTTSGGNTILSFFILKSTPGYENQYFGKFLHCRINKSSRCITPTHPYHVLSI